MKDDNGYVVHSGKVNKDSVNQILSELRRMASWPTGWGSSTPRSGRSLTKAALGEEQGLSVRSTSRKDELARLPDAVRLVSCVRSLPASRSAHRLFTEYEPDSTGNDDSCRDAMRLKSIVPQV